MLPDYEEFNNAYKEVMRIITGIEQPFPAQRFETMKVAIEKAEGAYPEEMHVMQKLVLTLKKILNLFPQLPDLPSFKEAQKILETYFGFQQSGFRTTIHYELRALNLFERELRRFMSPLKEMDAPEKVYHEEVLEGLKLRRMGEEEVAIKRNFPAYEKKLSIAALNISERCFGRCPTCSIDALPNDLLMDWELLDGLTKSPQVIFLSEVRLGDGEALLYQDKKTGKNLFDVIENILSNRAVSVQFTTAGLIPQNRRFGRPVLEALESLGPYASELNINISFNFFFGRVRDVDSYVEAMDETFRSLSRSACRKIVLLMYDEENKQETLDRFAPLKEKYRLDHEERSLGKSGRGIKKNPATCRELSDHDIDESLAKTIECELATTGRGAPTEEEHRKLSTCRFLRYKDLGEVPKLAVRADGSLTPFCLAPGTRGTAIGNVFDNDAVQVIALEQEFRKEMKKRVLAHEGTVFCEEHRKWNRTFKAPKSKNPIVRMRRQRKIGNC